MSSNNQINDITGIIKLLGERILKIERTLLYYNKHIKEVEDSKSFEARIANLERREKSNKIVETDLKKRIVFLEQKKTNENKTIDEEKSHLANYFRIERTKIEESQRKLIKNVELFETSIKGFEQKIRSRKL
uniref:Uncharacterized protein n=1 Tax=viral metagenome TaxID=1070528 RepID=A0A6C0EJX5_9ZZZZ